MRMWISVAAVLALAAVVGFRVVNGNCTSCGLTGMRSNTPVVAAVASEPASPAADPEPAFTRVQRPGSVDLEAEYDLADLAPPLKQIHTLLPRDAIPALTDPKLEPVAHADWLGANARILVVTVGEQTVGVPLAILNFHEIANMTVGGQPVAATYCPLCDSATLVSRTVMVKPADPLADAHEEVLDFGVSGALFNSNVLMYDRQTKGLWSQLGMRCISGPLVGTQLDQLPIRIIPLVAFKSAHPKAMIVSRDTGHKRPYSGDAYAGYFATDRLMVPVAGSDALRKDLPKKTLGLGVEINGRAWFITAGAIGERYELETPAGTVIASTSEAGINVIEAPPSVRTAQAFYYAWTVFFPDAEVITP